MTTSGEASRQAATWEDQIVPTLRKRLEHESAYLSNRLSSSNFSDLSSNSYTSGLGLQIHPTPAHNAFPSSGPSSPPPHGDTHFDARARTRTTSNPHLLNPLALRDSVTSSSSSRKTSAPPERLERPTHIPSRPRSSTNLAGRPKPSRTPSNQSTSSALRPKRSVSPLPNTMRGEGLSGRMPEAHIKNELPPFILYPDEAMRLAEHGHDYDLDSFGSNGMENGVSRFGNENWENPEDDTNKRRRSITMRNPASPQNAHKRDRSSRGPSGIPRPSTGSRGIDGMPRSVTGQTLGLGQPGARLGASQKGRSASSNVRATSTNSSSARSASLNMLATPYSAGSSRLGPAAHWIPPESTYTPPKGTDWDDVVIPSVAKKLGMSGTKSEMEAGEEGDLAVEWDKDGVPIKWVKRPPVQIVTSRQQPGGIDFSAGFVSSPEEAEWNAHAPIPSGPSGFSPTFEPSPDNPLHQSTSSRVTQPTPTPTPQKPLLRPHRSGQGIELSPVRAQSTNTYGHESPASQPPFTSLAPNPVPQQNSTTSLPRKPSNLGRLNGVSPAASRQASHRSMREAYHQAPSTVRGPSSTQPLPSGSASAHNAAEQSRRRDASPSSSFGMNPAGEGMNHQSGMRPNGNVHWKKEDESHGKGCGCVVM